MNRLDRITSILLKLQSKRLVRAQDLAEHFDISIRTVYRDIRSLEAAGVPIVSEAGVGYSLMEGYRLPPVMFTPDEAMTFLAAEKLMENFTDAKLTEHYQSALLKIKAVLRNDEKDLLENLEQSIFVQKKHNTEKGPPPSFLPLILQGISQKKVLFLKYLSGFEEKYSERNIEPIGIYFSHHWYLLAYCRLRSDYRSFRLDRIQELRMPGDIFEPHSITLKKYLNSLTHKGDLHNVVLSVHPSCLKYISDEKYYHGYIAEKRVNDRVEMSFLTYSLNAFAHWLLLFGNKAEIIRPDALRDEVKQLVAGLQEFYGQ